MFFGQNFEINFRGKPAKKPAGLIVRLSELGMHNLCAKGIAESKPGMSRMCVLVHLPEVQTNYILLSPTVNDRLV